MAQEQEGLRKEFDNQLFEVWREWLEQNLPGSPFKDLDENNPFWDNAGFNYDVGYLTGVGAAMGWSLDRPKSLAPEAGAVR